MISTDLFVVPHDAILVLVRESLDDDLPMPS